MTAEGISADDLITYTFGDFPTEYVSPIDVTTTTVSKSSS